MRKPLTALLVATLAAAPFAAPRITHTLIYTSRGHTTSDGIVATRDGRHIYYVRDSVDLVLYDRAANKETRLFGNMIARRADLALSPAGDRLVFCRNGEDGDGPFLWSIALDPATGLSTGSPKRLSMTKASDPAFSPDGQSVAFGAGVPGSNETLTIVPAAGGPERTVAATKGDIWPIQWTPDGGALYFGLSFAESRDSTKNGIYKVAASGGSPAMVIRAVEYGAYPGLSPDGRWILTWDSTQDSVILATAAGKRVLTYSPDAGEGDLPDAWFDNTRGVTAVNHRPRPSSVLTFANGSNVTITDTLVQTTEPRWSPDGRRIATAAASPWGVAVMNADGTNRRLLARENAPARRGVIWSPDGASIAFMAGGFTLHVVDVASGTSRLLTKVSRGLDPRWRSDSKAMFYTAALDTLSTDPVRSVTVHERTTAGLDRVVRTLQLHCNNNGCQAVFVNDTLLVEWNPREYRVYNLKRQDEARLIFKASEAGQNVPTFSSGGNWMAVRSQNAAGEQRIIDVMQIDGSSRHTVTLPFETAAGSKNPWISPDGKRLVVMSGKDTDGIETFYEVDVASGKATKLATVSRASSGRGGLAEPSVSPDGRAVTFSTPMPPSVSFYEVNVSSLLKASAAKH